MNEKSFADIHTHDEDITEATKPKVAEAGSPDKPVGVNIVENPLTVSNWSIL